jgi:hypothetical protein
MRYLWIISIGVNSSLGLNSITFHDKLGFKIGHTKSYEVATKLELDEQNKTATSPA